MTETLKIVLGSSEAGMLFGAILALIGAITGHVIPLMGGFVVVLFPALLKFLPTCKHRT
mgnify:CR=1 FL=1